MTVTLDLRELRLSKGLPQDIIGKGLKMPGPKLTRRMATAMGVTTEAVFTACAESRRRASQAPAEAGFATAVGTP